MPTNMQYYYGSPPPQAPQMPTPRSDIAIPPQQGGVNYGMSKPRVTSGWGAGRGTAMPSQGQNAQGQGSGRIRSDYMDWNTQQWQGKQDQEFAKTLALYQSMAQEPIVGGGEGTQQALPTPGQGQEGLDTWRYGSPSDMRRQDRKGGTYGGIPSSGQSTTTAPSGPTGPAPDLDLGDITLDLPEYKPPKEDESVRKRAREEAYQRGRGDLMSQTHNAIISTKSIDNPAARKQMIGQVLQSMGSALTNISRAAGQEADTKAARKRAEQLNIYNAQYQAESAEAKAAYDQQMMEAMAEFEMQQAQYNQPDPNYNTKEGGGDYIGEDTKRVGGIDYRWAGPKAGWVRDY